LLLEASLAQAVEQMIDAGLVLVQFHGGSQRGEFRVEFLQVGQRGSRFLDLPELGEPGNDIGQTGYVIAVEGVRREKVALSSGCKPHPAISLQPEATGAGMEATKCLKPSGSGSRIGDRASVQAATRVNAEQASKRTMCRPTRRPFRGRLIRLGE
jgi:hypothetical protein